MDRTAPNPMLEEKEQYHHYIPRFVLRAFAAHPQPPPVRQKKKQRKKPKKTTVQDAGDLEGVKDDCPNEVGPSNAAKKPEPATQPQPNHDEPTPPVQKMEEEEKPTEAAAKDAEDPRGVENYLLDEAVASNAPEEPEPTVYHQPTYNEPTRPVRKKKKQKKRPTKTTAKDAENPKDVENDSPDEADASNAPKEPESTAQPQPNYDEPTRPPRENKNRKKKLTKTTAGDAEDAEDFKGVEYHSPDGAGPSNAPKEPDSAAQPQPKYDEPTPRAQKSKKRRERKPAKTTAVDAEDPKGVENDSPDEVGPFNAPKEPEDTVEVEIINDTGKSKPRKSRFDPSKDPYIKFYDLESGVLDFAKVGRSYGIPDMYKDVDNERAYHVEELLSKLESGAASIYHRIKNDHESGKCNFSVTRKDLNLLRKFLFVMRYRSHKFWSKYTGTIDTYEHNDRNKLVEFLKERSITDLRQVWLMGLEVIVRTEIDADGEWLQTIGREIFEGDANMYVFHMRESYMAFCEPQSSGDEFILTNNGFGIFEGPVVFDPVNLKSGSAPRLGDSVYTEFHKLAPLSPRLILVLRSNYLRDEPIWQKRRKISNELEPRRNHDSLLQDLPIKPPKVHYWLLPKKSKLVHTLEDEFFFEIYKVKTKQVHMINTIMLEEAFRSITWVSDESLVRSLRAFLENPRFMLGAFAGFPEFQPLMALRRQKQRLLSLWDKPYPTEGMRPIEELNNTNESMKKVRYLQPYYKLGGAPELFPYDFHQAELLIQFRSFIADHCGPSIPWRNKVNRAKIKFMSNFPPRIVWFHVQKWKVLANRVQRGLQHSPVTDGDFDILKEPGPEHLIANLVDILPFRLLSRLMLETTLKGMLRLSCREKLTAQRASEQELESGMISQEMDLMSQFGGFGGSWSLAGTPYHFDPVDFCDPFRPDIPHDLLYEIYVQDLILRSNLRGRIENMILGAHGTPEVYGWLSQLLWDHLYQIPASFPG